jgi:hypothetical protein
VVRGKQNCSADHGHERTSHPEGGEERAPYDCADDADSDVQSDTFECLPATVVLRALAHRRKT